MFSIRPVDIRAVACVAILISWISILVGPTPAEAIGTYTVTVPSTVGWPGWVSPSLGGPFRIDPFRISTKGGTWAPGEYRRWRLVAPGSTRIAGGHIAGHAGTATPGMVAEVREGSDGGAVRVVWSSSDKTRFNVPLIHGNDWVEFGLMATAQSSSPTPDTNFIDVDALTVEMSDEAAPVAVSVSEPEPLTWYGPSRCAPWSYSATDTGSGIASFALTNATSRIEVAHWNGRPRPGLAPGYLSISRAGCFDASHAVHGLNRLLLTFSDVAGRISTSTMAAMFDLLGPTIRRTGTDPIASFDTPEPQIEYTIVDSDSGIDRITATINDVPARITTHGTDTVIHATGPLPPGTYAVMVSGIDRAGNTTHDTQTITIVDHTAPMIHLTSPGTHGSASPWVAASAIDHGSGIVPAQWSITVDGVPSEIVSASDAIAGPLGMLTPGTHHIVLSVADGAGNIATMTHDYTVDAVPGTSTAAAPGSASGTYLQLPLAQSYEYGSPISMRLLAAQSGRPLAGYRILLRRGRTVVADAITDMQGIGIMHLAARRPGRYTATVAGTTLPARQIPINVRPHITLRTTSHRPHAGTVIPIHGRVSPVSRGTRAHLYAQIDGNWYPLRRSVPVDAQGKFHGTITSAVRGVIAVQARVPARDGWSAGRSNTLVLQIT